MRKVPRGLSREHSSPLYPRELVWIFTPSRRTVRLGSIAKRRGESLRIRESGCLSERGSINRTPISPKNSISRIVPARRAKFLKNSRTYKPLSIAIFTTTSCNSFVCRSFGIPFIFRPSFWFSTQTLVSISFNLPHRGVDTANRARLSGGHLPINILNPFFKLLPIPTCCIFLKVVRSNNLSILLTLCRFFLSICFSTLSTIFLNLSRGIFIQKLLT